MRLVEDGTGRLVGTVDAGSAHGTVHEGAVYLHQGETYLVLSLDLEQGVATVVLDDPGYSTSAREVTDIEIIAEREHVPWGLARVSLGDVRVTHQVVSFLRRRVPSGETLGEEPLDLPERTLATTAVWWTLPRGAAGGERPGRPRPARAPRTRRSTRRSGCCRSSRPATAGTSAASRRPCTRTPACSPSSCTTGTRAAQVSPERGFHAARAWLTATREAIAACRCEDGCPSCVQSPKCGNQNNPLDKRAAVVLLDVLLGAC